MVKLAPSINEVLKEEKAKLLKEILKLTKKFSAQRGMDDPGVLRVIKLQARINDFPEEIPEDGSDSQVQGTT